MLGKMYRTISMGAGGTNAEDFLDLPAKGLIRGGSPKPTQLKLGRLEAF